LKNDLLKLKGKNVDAKPLTCPNVIPCGIKLKKDM